MLNSRYRVLLFCKILWTESFRMFQQGPTASILKDDFQRKAIMEKKPK